MNEWKYFLKHNINISIIICFKQYPPSIIQSVEFTGCVACQNNWLVRSVHDCETGLLPHLELEAPQFRMNLQLSSKIYNLYLLAILSFSISSTITMAAFF